MHSLQYYTLHNKILTNTSVCVYNIKTCVPVSSTCIIYVVGAYIFYIRCNRSWKINRGASVLCKGGLTSKAAGTARPGTMYTYILLFKHTHIHTHTWVHNAPNDQYDFLAPLPPLPPLDVSTVYNESCAFTHTHIHNM